MYNDPRQTDMPLKPINEKFSAQQRKLLYFSTIPYQFTFQFTVHLV